VLQVQIGDPDGYAPQIAPFAAEQALRESNERYRTIFEMMDEGFCVFEILLDDEGIPVDYRWLETNSAFERHTGLTSVVGRTAREMVPGLEQHWVDIYGRVALTGEPVRFVQQSEAMGRWFDVEAFRIGDPSALRVALLFTDITERKRAEDALRELNETLEQRIAERTAQVRQLTASLTLAEQEERRRVSQVLHDDLQQLLYGVMVRLQILHDRLAGEDNPSMTRSVQRLQGQVEQAVHVTRTLVTELNPPIFESEGLEGALDWLVHHMREMHGLAATMTVREPCEPRSARIRALLVQMTRELLFNVVKHAGVLEAHLVLEREGTTLRLHVEDEGVGFDVEAATEGAKQQRTYGLHSIAERLRLLGGDLRIHSAPGQGTRVTLIAPCSDDSEQEES
jgi:two-component system, chemotaxis family, CheB/CheR fusion protein